MNRIESKRASVCKSAILIIVSIVITLASGTADGFHNNLNEGGHDKIIKEAGELKRQVHGGDDAFNRWLDSKILDNKGKEATVLDRLRWGAHDEDSTIPFVHTWFGPNGNEGGWLNHFYGPTFRRGLFMFTPGVSAPGHAKYYVGKIKKHFCKPEDFAKLSPEKKASIYDYVGRIMHLIQDMSSPPHVKGGFSQGNYVHGVFGSIFENYVRDNWDGISGSQVYTQKVNTGNYSGRYEVGADLDTFPTMDESARKAREYPSDMFLTKRQCMQPQGYPCETVPDPDKIKEPAEVLVPEAVLRTAGFLDTIYKCVKFGCGCKPDNPPPPGPIGPPGNDHPDDRFDVSDWAVKNTQFGLLFYDLLDLYGRTALRKGDPAPFLVRQLMGIYGEANTLPPDTSQVKKDEIVAKLQTLENRLDGLSVRDPELAPDVAVLKNGYYEQTAALLFKYKEPIRLLDPDFDPAIVKDHPVMLIPTAGLAGMEKSASLKAKLDEYVKNGGILVVLSQQYGSHWEILPAPVNTTTGERHPVRAYGYTEDTSCLANSVYIDNYHPVLSVFSQSTPSIAVDGYFTSYPDNAVVLLRRTANGQPAMIMYPYGNGQVIATTVFTDFAAGLGQANGNEISFIANILSWAKKPARLPEIKPTETVTVPITVVNQMDVPSVSAKLQIYTPDRSKIVSEQTVGASIPPKGSFTINTHYTAPQTAPLGIYHIDYVLLGSDGSILQPQTETDSGRFAISNPAAHPYKSPDFNFSVQSDQEYYFFDEQAVFTVKAWNKTGREANLLFDYRIHNIACWGCDSFVKRPFMVPANGSTTFDIVIPKVESLGSVFGQFRDESNKAVGSAFKGIMLSNMTMPVVKVFTDKYSYGRGETVDITATVQTNELPNRQGALVFRIRYMDWWQGEPVVLDQVSYPLEFVPGTTITQKHRYTIPANMKSNPYEVEAVVTVKDKPVSNYITGIFIPAPRLAVAPQLPQYYSENNTLIFLVENKGTTPVLPSVLTLSLKGPDNKEAWKNQYAVPALGAGTNTTVSAAVTVPGLGQGTYALSYSLDFGESPVGSTISIQKYFSSSLSLDKYTYKAGENVAIHVDAANNGNMNLDDTVFTVSIPSIGCSQTKTITIANGQKVGVDFVVPLYNSLSPGKHDVTVTIVSGTESLDVRKASFVIPESALVIKYQGLETLNAGDTTTLNIENTGGASTEYSADNISLIDSRGNVLFRTTSSGAIPAGENKKLADISIPGQIASDHLKITASVTDTKTGKKESFVQWVRARGQTASVESITDKSIYFKNDAQTAFSRIANGPFAIMEGTLKLVVNRVDSGDNVSFEHFLPKYGYSPLSVPDGIAISADGSLYVANSSSGVIIKLDSTGKVLTTIGETIPAEGNPPQIHDVTIGPDGSLYICDSRYHQVLKYDQTGNYLMKFGAYGTGDGQLAGPMGIAAGPDGSLYVADSYNNRIQKFDANGTFLAQWGTQGTGDGQFMYPYAIRVSNDGFVYVVDRNNRRIQKFDANGTFLAKWGTQGTGDGQFEDPQRIAISSDGIIFVTDSYRRRIQKFEQNGTFLKAWQSSGSDNPEGDSLYGIAVGRDGAIYMTEGNYDKLGNIQKFDLDGNFQSLFYQNADPSSYPFSHGPITVGADSAIYVAADRMVDNPRNVCVLKYDQYGSYLGIMGCIDYSDSGYVYLTGIAVGPNGTAYVVESNYSEIYVFDRNGTPKTIGNAGRNDGEFMYPSDIAGAADGTLYVADARNYRIQKLDSEGRFLGKWGTQGTGDGQFSSMSGIAISADGSVYVTDTDNYRIQKFDANGNFISKWSTQGEGRTFKPDRISVAPDNSIFIIDSRQNYVVQFSANGSFLKKYGGRSPLIPAVGESSRTDISFNQVKFAAISPMGTVYAMDVVHAQRLAGGGLLNKVFETTMPVSLAANAGQQFTTNIGILNATGKFHLEATLTNSIGSTVAQSAYPFYIVKENVAVIFSTDKKQYRPGETVTIRGEVKNLASVTANGVVVTLTQKLPSGTETLYTSTLNLPANGSHPFTATTRAGSNGTYAVTGSALQNSVSVFESTDYYEVASPAITANVTAPEMAGNDPFTIKVDITNTGKADGTVTVLSSIDGQAQILAIPQGVTKTVTYQQQISENRTYTFTISGDASQTVTKTVSYGLASTIVLSASSTYPAGRITVPVTITNTGSLDETISLTTVLQPTGVTGTKTCFVPKTGSINDSFLFDLAEGDYELVVSSLSPPATAQAAFAVRRDVNIAMAPLVVGTGPGGTSAVTATLTNSGFSSLDGSARISITNAQGSLVWQGTQAVSIPSAQPPAPVPVTLPYNTSSLPSGNYTLAVELFNGNGQSLASQSMPLVISSPVITLSRTPQALTVRPGENALFIFKVANSGGKEGMAEISFKSYDFINTVKREVVRPGEEKDVSFSFTIPSDLEEKDYFADYAFRSEDGATAKGQIKYHFSGINLTVSASLDKQKYRDGDTAHLTLGVTQPTGASTQNLFARINYPGYEESRPFSLSGSQTLAFDVPLAAITGEKIFYGIYHESGRAIHLNSLYVYKEGGVFTVTTNKQFYNPGESVTMSITGTSAGTMTLSAPNNYTDTFSFSGSVTKSFTLPSAATAGTYYINASLKKSDTETVSFSTPFDIAGIQVKVKESILDKGKCTASDTIKLSLKIESNISSPATLKVWSTDPDKNSNLIGQRQITLTTGEPLLVAGEYPFSSNTSGIHRLIYGIYSGDLLLVAGNLGFDVGDAVLLSLSTDRTDYPGGSEQVTVRASMYGAAGASLALELDGTSMRTDTVTLNGFTTVNLPLVNIKPGLHTLKGTLSAGGLANSKETQFLYGSGLPDLVSDVWAGTSSIGKDAVMKFTVSAANVGKSAAPATTVTLSDSSSLLVTYTTEGLLPGGRAPFEYTMNVMGKAGERTLQTVIDSGNLIPELNEDNNTATRTIKIPHLVIITETSKDTYKAREQVPINATVLNLTPTTFYPNLTLVTAIKGPAGTEVYRKSSTISAPASQVSSFSEVWNTAGLYQEGVYIITQTIMNASQLMAERTRGVTIQKASGFVLRADTTSFTVAQGQSLTFPITVDAITGWTSEVTLGTEGTPPGMSVSITPQKLVPSGSAAVTVNTAALQPGTHTLTITGQGVENSETIQNTLAITIKVIGFALSYRPASVTIRQKESAQVTLAVSAENGYTGNITLSTRVVPRGLRVMTNPQTFSAPANVTVTVQSSKFVSPGDYSIDITATDGVTAKSINLPVTVTKNPDLTRGYLTTPGPGPLNPAMVTVFNKDFTPVLELAAFPTKFGAVAVMGDIDGDGEDEIIVAPGPDPNAGGKLRIYKKNGTLLLEKKIFDMKFGLTLAVGDIDGDWKEEIVVGAGPDPRNISRIKVLSYVNNTLVDTGIDFNPFPKKKNCLLCSDLYFGAKVAVGDVNNDGILEIIAGAGPNPLNPARVGVFTVNTTTGPGTWKIGSTYSDFIIDFGDWQNLSFGVNVAAGDIDGDGCDEIIAGAGPNPLHAPVVKVYKADGVSTGISFNAYPPEGGNDHHLGVYVAAGDLAGDGTTRIITGLGPSPLNKSWVRIFNENGAFLSNGFYAYPDNVMFGVRVSTGNVGE